MNSNYFYLLFIILNLSTQSHSIPSLLYYSWVDSIINQLNYNKNKIQSNTNEVKILTANEARLINQLETQMNCDSIGATVIIPCDDGNPNTINDIQTILIIDSTVCIPCAGVEDCDLDVSIEIVDSLVCTEDGSVGVTLSAANNINTGNEIITWKSFNTFIGEEEEITVFDEAQYFLAVEGENGCRDSTTVEIIIPLLNIDVNYNMQAESCPGSEDGVLTILEIAEAQPPFTFSFPGFSPSMDTLFSDLAPGTYTLGIIDGNECEYTEEIIIEGGANYSVDLGDDISINLGEEAILSFETDATIDSIIWQGQSGLSCLDCSSPTVRPNNTSVYRVTIIDENGCEWSDEITVFVNASDLVFLPNIFSPNGDQVNDEFIIQTVPNVTNIRTFAIYDRWGGQVLLRENIAPGDEAARWDGRVNNQVMDQGVYTYKIDIELDEDSQTFYGTVTLIR